MQHNNSQSTFPSCFFLAIALLLPLSANLILAYTPLSDASLRLILSGSDALDPRTDTVLSPLLIPRVPGTPGSVKARTHITSFFAGHLPAWSIELHNVTMPMPIDGKNVTFVNVIARRDPPWTARGDVSRLTLAAHYDSLYRPEGFIGAIDSAAPCAMLLQVARGVEEALERKWKGMQERGENRLEEEKGVQILFLDGEEAWVAWSKEDSLYGSRALAETWEVTFHETSSLYATPLHSISLFLLLDLLGSPNPQVPSFFRNTHWAYMHLATAERRMREHNLLETTPSSVFLPDMEKTQGEFRANMYVEDDHVPFMARGVKILHVIPYPFPDVWHTMEDDAEHLDLPTVRDWVRILTVFLAEWMELASLLDKDGGDETNGLKDEL